MAFAFKTGFVWYCLCLAVCIGGNTVTAFFEIQREKIDTFTNLECQKSNNCTDEQCAKYGAKCVDDKCERCRCDKVGRGTFLASNSTTGNCTKDENIIRESVPTQRFRLEKTTLTNQCLTVADEQNYNISAKSCTSSINMYWIWIKTRVKNKIQLMNVMTLQCLEFLTSTDVCESEPKNRTSGVALKQCNETDGQYITPGQQGQSSIQSILCSTKNYYLRLRKKRNNVGYPAFSQRSEQDLWINSKRMPIIYTGCYRFQNETFMLYLDNETCCENPCSHQFSAPIFYGDTQCHVEWSKSKILYGDDVQWQNFMEISTRKLVSIKSGHGNLGNIKMLKVYQEALTKFNGSLVRLAISCANGMKLVEEHCLLLKFKSLPRKRETMTTSPTTTTSSETTTSPVMTTSPTTTTSSETTTSSKMRTSSETTTSPVMITSPKMITSSEKTTSPTIKVENKDSEESSTNTIAIAAPVSLFAIILVLTLVCFVCYRKRKRREKLSNDEGNMSNPNYSKPAYEDPNKMYEMPAVPATPATYEYIDNNDIAKPKQPQPELKYDYATNTEIPRINLSTQPKSGGDAGQPELKYDYAANTDIPKITLDRKPEAQGPAGQPELKYDYATNTEIPRITLDTLAKTQGVANQPELKYDYATNTEIPRINLNPQPKSDDAVDPSDNAMYHTLEEPNPPHYSTLEEPAAETSPLVTYDTPHSGDPMYHVLEDSNDANSQP